MRRDFWIGFLLAVALLVFLGAEENAPGPVGRFQLFQGSYFHYAIKEKRFDSVSEQKGVFLLDTSTGEVRQYIQTNVSAGWGSPLRELPLASQ